MYTITLTEACNSVNFQTYQFLIDSKKEKKYFPKGNFDKDLRQYICR